MKYRAYRCGQPEAIVLVSEDAIPWFIQKAGEMFNPLKQSNNQEASHWCLPSPDVIVLTRSQQDQHEKDCYKRVERMVVDAELKVDRDLQATDKAYVHIDLTDEEIEQLSPYQSVHRVVVKDDATISLVAEKTGGRNYQLAVALPGEEFSKYVEKRRQTR